MGAVDDSKYPQTQKHEINREYYANKSEPFLYPIWDA